MYYVYILKCLDDTFYTGITTDIDRRIRQHNGEIKGGARYTMMRRPVELLHYEVYENRSLASKREFEIKSWSRIEKSNYIKKYT